MVDSSVLKGVNEARFKVRPKARRSQNASRRLPKDVGHGRRMPSYPRLLRGVKVYALFASWGEAYAFFAKGGKRARAE